jgi:hypothetical protein
MLSYRVAVPGGFRRTTSNGTSSRILCDRSRRNFKLNNGASEVELEIDEVTRCECELAEARYGITDPSQALVPMRHEPDYFTVFASDMGDTGRIDRLTPG